jgi:hypothetical protein
MRRGEERKEADRGG